VTLRVLNLNHPDRLLERMAADGVYLCSVADQQRLLDDIPGARTMVIPNAADVDFYRPRPTDPQPDGRTVVFFGLMSYMPNIDGATYFIQEIWPRIADANPDARCKIIGGSPSQPRSEQWSQCRIFTTRQSILNSWLVYLAGHCSGFTSC